MTTPAAPRPPTAERVAVAGSRTPVGAALLAGLGAAPDGRPPAHVFAADLPEDLAGADVLVVASGDLVPAAAPDGAAGQLAVLAAAQGAGVRRVVLVSSAAVYGARADNPVPLDDDAPLRAGREGLLAGLLALEDAAAQLRADRPGVAVAVLRPAAVVGPGIDTVVSRHFAARRLLQVREAPMRWQFCHVDDLVAAVRLAAAGGVDGAATCGCEGWLTALEVSGLSGLRRLDLPAPLVFGAAERLHRAGVVPGPSSELALACYPWVVSSSALRAAGWRPVHDNTTALEALLEELAAGHDAAGTDGDHEGAGRRGGRRDAAVAGAAGATVAVLGAAALVRRARQRRR